MSERIIKTTILLRNDTEANWLSANPVLSAGEAGVIRKEDGTVKLVVGDGVTELSGLEYIGGDAAQHFEVSAFEELADIEVVHGGDTAVVKEEIANGKYSYTAYVYDAELTAWKAMDGNYSASNVYFDDNITITQSLGNITASGGQAVLPAAGKNIPELFEAIWSKESDSMTVDRVVNTSLSITNATLSCEVGTEVSTLNTAVNATFTVTDTGTWAYGSFDANGTKSSSNDTGITVSATLSNAIDSTVSAKSGMVKNNTLTLSCGTYKTLITADYVTDTSCTVNVVTGSWSHTASTTKPLTNLKNAISSATVADTKISNIVSFPATAENYEAAKGGIAAKGKTSAGTKAITLYGWRKMWIGGSTATGELTEAEIKGLRLTVGGKAYSDIKNTTMSKVDIAVGAINGIKRFIIALPAGRSLTEVLLKSASNTPITTTYKTGHKVMQITGANSVLPANYNVYVYEPASIGAGEVHTITIS